MYLGIKVGQGAGSTKLDLGAMILLALMIVFLAVALIIFPVTLEAICSTLTGDGSGINSAFTGVEDFLLMSPLLLTVALVGGAIVSGFFGLRRLSSSD